MMLNVDVLMQAGRELLGETIRDECEDADSTLKLPKPFKNADSLAFVEHVALADEDARLELVARMGYMVGRVSEKWGHDVGLVFYHAGLNDHKSQADALYYLLMGCFGHGIGIDDKYADEIGKAEEVLEQGFNAAPLLFDQFQELGELATAKMVLRKGSELSLSKLLQEVKDYAEGLAAAGDKASFKDVFDTDAINTDVATFDRERLEEIYDEYILDD